MTTSRFEHMGRDSRAGACERPGHPDAVRLRWGREMSPVQAIGDCLTLALPVEGSDPFLALLDRLATSDARRTAGRP